MKTNIDTREIIKFNEMASSWWDEKGPCKPLHDINPLRLHFIQENISLKGKKILDIGCGGGILTEALARQTEYVTGIDMSPEAITIARLHASIEKLNIDYQQVTAETFAEKNPQQFDIITCMELLEHVPHPESLIRACAKLIKPNGGIFFSTLNRTLTAYLFAILGAEYFLKLLPKGTHDYQKFIKPAELEKSLFENDLKLQTIKGIKYNPLFQKYTLTSNVSINYLIYCEPK
ncbi:MAG: Ubiquinone biosynthesis O-methyltransferase [Legionellaceae bacterium]